MLRSRHLVCDQSRHLVCDKAFFVSEPFKHFKCVTSFWLQYIDGLLLAAFVLERSFLQRSVLSDNSMHFTARERRSSEFCILNHIRTRGCLCHIAATSIDPHAANAVVYRARFRLYRCSLRNVRKLNYKFIYNYTKNPPRSAERR